MRKIILGTALAAALNAGPVCAVTFDWTLANDDGTLVGESVSGTVTFAGDGVGIAATSLVIDSLPAAFGLSTPIELIGGVGVADAAWDFPLVPVSNSWTVAGGAVTAADFDQFSDDFAFQLALNIGGQSRFDQMNVRDVRDADSAGLSFTEQGAGGADVPVPAALPMLLLGLGGLGLIARRRS